MLIAFPSCSCTNVPCHQHSLCGLLLVVFLHGPFQWRPMTFPPQSSANDITCVVFCQQLFVASISWSSANGISFVVFRYNHPIESYMVIFYSDRIDDTSNPLHNFQKLSASLFYNIQTLLCNHNKLLNEAFFSFYVLKANSSHFSRRTIYYKHLPYQPCVY